MDSNMPKMDALEATRRIKEHSRAWSLLGSRFFHQPIWAAAPHSVGIFRYQLPWVCAARLQCVTTKPGEHVFLRSADIPSPTTGFLSTRLDEFLESL